MGHISFLKLSKKSKVFANISEIDKQKMKKWKNPEIATVPSKFAADTVCAFYHVWSDIGLFLFTSKYL